MRSTELPITFSASDSTQSLALLIDYHPVYGSFSGGYLGAGAGSATQTPTTPGVGGHVAIWSNPTCTAGREAPDYWMQLRPSLTTCNPVRRTLRIIAQATAAGADVSLLSFNRLKMDSCPVDGRPPAELSFSAGNFLRRFQKRPASLSADFDERFASSLLPVRSCIMPRLMNRRWAVPG